MAQGGVSMQQFPEVQALTFDLFGTVVDLGGSLTPFIARFLRAKGSSASPQWFWDQWRARQRLEQYQDTMLMLGHSGYLETSRRALVYTLALGGVEASGAEVAEFMRAWQELSPFQDVLTALERLKTRYRLVALSNGDPDYLDHLVRHRIRWSFDGVISVQTVGAFKPHPGVYRRAATVLGLEVGQCLMVSANSFDVMGARACGYRGVYVNRYQLPYEDTPYRPDATVKDFTELTEALL
jgi:2-haloacid dehalogenase